jgi:magnesium chelatase subunit I
MDGLRNIAGMKEAVQSLVNPESPPEVSSAIEFILEGLHLSNKLNKEIIKGRMVYKEGGKPVSEKPQFTSDE